MKTTANVALTEKQFESMMFITNNKRYIKAKDIEPYWPFFGNTPVAYSNNISLHFYKSK